MIKINRLSTEVLRPARLTFGLDIRAHLLSETKRKNNFLIPSYGTRTVPTGLTIEPWGDPFLILALSCSSTFIIPNPLILSGELRIPLYNGTHEAQYIQHEQRIAVLISLATTPGFNVQ